MQFRKSTFILSVCLLLMWDSAAQAGYIDNLDGTITDTGTGLMWQQATAPGTYNWQQALSYCENLELATHTDWRMPTVKELASLTDSSQFNPVINTGYFFDTVAAEYWSSTQGVTQSPAWFVNLLGPCVGQL